ncbi:MAG: hypothetical protein ACI8XB_001036 [Patiriisocius sp.]|jgi:hypothetical protein
MKSLISIITFATLIVLVISCEKEFDQPPVPVIPTGELITLQTIRDSFPSGDTLFFAENRTLYANVSVDEASGNLYREVYIDDGTNAIILRLDNPGGLDKGDSIQINLTNLIVTEFAGTMQLGEANAVDDVVILENNVFVEPELVTLSEVVANPEAYEAKLLKFENVEFSSSDLGTTYADPDGMPLPISQNKIIQNCEGIEITLRNSGFANFAGELVPEGNGDLIAVLSQFNSDYQLKINNTDDILFSGLRCNEDTTMEEGVYLNQDFSSGNIFNGGWTTQVAEGPFNWETSSAGGPDNAPYASISNFDNGNSASEAWLITPSMDLTIATAPMLNFISAVGFFGDDMEVYLSTDYDGISLPADATWIPLDPVLASVDPDFFAWFPSGAIDLSAFLQPSVYIGFRYTGSDSDGATWEIDDVSVIEQ